MLLRIKTHKCPKVLKIKSSLGYTKNNVQLVEAIVNHMKTHLLDSD
jgi:hypothetical protein